MADEKFSEFAAATDIENAQFAGLQGGVNKRFAIALLQALGFIPLSGTANGSPVTGMVVFNNTGIDNIEIDPKDGDESAEIRVYNNTRSNYFSINTGRVYRTSGDGDAGLNFDALSIAAFFDNPLSRGLGSTSDHTANITDLDYPQYKMLPKVSGNYADDTAAAVGGIAIGCMYHTDGVVKIRLS